jgi:hypothetical protein
MLKGTLEEMFFEERKRSKTKDLMFYADRELQESVEYAYKEI